MASSKTQWKVGVARRKITPPSTTELAGLGYYLGRTGKRVRDDLTATAMVISQAEKSVAFIAMDLMWNDERFTRLIREGSAKTIPISGEAICVNFSHTHNAPTAGLILGAGTQDRDYLERAAALAVEAIVEAWGRREPAVLRRGQGELAGMTFNRTREDGPCDTRVGVLRADRLDGSPLAIAVNFHSHCTAHMEVDLEAVSRDWPGEVVDQIEVALRGVTALYLQGVCGDVNFRREFNGTAKRFEPAQAVTRVVLEATRNGREIAGAGISSCVETVSLPTRRWTREEIMRDRDEGLHRLKTGDTADWLNGVAKVCVGLPERLPLRYGGSVDKAVAAVSRFAVEWTDLISPKLDTMPEYLDTEVQAIRIGDFYLAATSCELFTSLGLELRTQAPDPDCFVLGYANGSIGYLPDAY
jgi:neutral ceramidase